MDAVHIKTSGFYCGACPVVVERALRTLPGVVDVVAVRSMGLTSVLFEEDRVTKQDLCARIRKAGFGAEVFCPKSADVAGTGSCDLGPTSDRSHRHH